MTARFLIGDTRDRLGELDDGTVDLILTSPPFLALRSYLPEDHPDKDREIGSEANPAEFIDVLLELTAAWGRVLAPHGSIAVELGDTYAGSGGAGGDYSEDGLRAGQPRFRQGYDRRDGRTTMQQGDYEAPLPIRSSGGDGWPLPKSLACIPQLYQVALAYGINPLTGQPSPAGRWRVRTLKPWIRSNPPVGALGDKERPATSYVIVACRASDRWFDLDAVRSNGSVNLTPRAGKKEIANPDRGTYNEGTGDNPAGAPPRDWWHHVDAILDTELAQRAGKIITGPTTVSVSGASRGISGGDSGNAGKPRDPGSVTQGVQGVHLRRALERAGILTTLEALDVSPKGYSGAHYAVWPPELCRLLIDEMCPRRVCVTCGQPSRRLISEAEYVDHGGRPIDPVDSWRHGRGGEVYGMSGGKTPGLRVASTLGWSDCGHNTWRPGHVLDPFAGSGTTLAVATGMGRQATGIDIDQRNAWLAQERVGMFLDIDLGVHADGARIP